MVGLIEKQIGCAVAGVEKLAAGAAGDGGELGVAIGDDQFCRLGGDDDLCICCGWR